MPSGNPNMSGGYSNPSAGSYSTGGTGSANAATGSASSNTGSRDSDYGGGGDSDYSSGSGRDGYDSGGYDSRSGSSGYSSSGSSMRNSDFSSLNARTGEVSRDTFSRDATYSGSSKYQSRLPGGEPVGVSTTYGPGATVVTPNQRAPANYVGVMPSKYQDRIAPAGTAPGQNPQLATVRNDDFGSRAFMAHRPSSPPRGVRSSSGGGFKPAGPFGQALADARNKGKMGDVASGGKRQGGTRRSSYRGGEGKKENPFRKLAISLIYGGPEGYRGSRH